MWQYKYISISFNVTCIIVELRKQLFEIPVNRFVTSADLVVTGTYHGKFVFIYIFSSTDNKCQTPVKHLKFILVVRVPPTLVNTFK